jgi:hypothetical protein
MINATLANITTVGDKTDLEAAKAELSRGPLLVKDDAIINWFGMADQVNWLIMIEKPGEYEVEVSQSYAGTKSGRYVVTLGKAILPRPVERTSSNAEFKTVTVGSGKFAKPGRYRIWVRPLEIASGDQLMRLQKLTLTRK